MARPDIKMQKKHVFFFKHMKENIFFFTSKPGKPGRAGPVRKIDFRAPGAKINFGKSRAGPGRLAKLIFAPRARKSILVK